LLNAHQSGYPRKRRKSCRGLMTAGIVGAGIMGQLMAFGLVNAGWEVTLFDPEMHNNCSQAAAGLLAPLLLNLKKIRR